MSSAAFDFFSKRGVLLIMYLSAILVLAAMFILLVASLSALCVCFLNKESECQILNARRVVVSAADARRVLLITQEKGREKEQILCSRRKALLLAIPSISDQFVKMLIALAGDKHGRAVLDVSFLRSRHNLERVCRNELAVIRSYVDRNPFSEGFGWRFGQSREVFVPLAQIQMSDPGHRACLKGYFAPGSERMRATMNEVSPVPCRRAQPPSFVKVPYVVKTVKEVESDEKSDDELHQYADIVGVTLNLLMKEAISSLKEDDPVGFDHYFPEKCRAWYCLLSYEDTFALLCEMVDIVLSKISDIGGVKECGGLDYAEHLVDKEMSDKIKELCTLSVQRIIEKEKVKCDVEDRLERN